MKLRFCLFWLLAIFYTHCFLAGFLPNEFVYTSVGALELCNFKISYQVTSFNNMHLVCNDVVSQIQTKVCPISIKIYLSDTVLVISPDQFFYLPARQKWIAAQDLQINDQLLLLAI